jgi:hypothetical protein
MPHRFVDEEVFAVEAADGGYAFAFKIGEQHFVKGTLLVPVGEFANRRGDDLMPGIVSQGGHDTFNIVRGLVAKVIVNDLIHLFSGE